ncbi:MAG: hypothetical protein K9H49_11965 [Bacteroidales bacterium]|nr:hypothetical protein [Bacteroidales bacterium]MCF8390801.1 hypothetical protein [Bacteroidales bacterium]
MIIKQISYPRAALIGNPSDGYYGKTIAFLFSNFHAEILLYESPELEIIPEGTDSTIFKSMEAMVAEVNLYGYYGGVRLLKAAIKRFYEYCMQNNIALDERNFTIRYNSDIPFRLGLAGSSAIITASMKAMMQFFDVKIKREILANLVLSVEKEELSISAGLQDRVAQAFEYPIFMDFNEKTMKERGYGVYKEIKDVKFPPLYISYRKDQSEGSEVVHNTLRERYLLGDKIVLDAIEKWKDLSDKAYEMLLSGNWEGLGQVINTNYDIRKSVMNISVKNQEMIDIARKTGASAKFTGSGGAIIGTYENEVMYEELKTRMSYVGVETLKPKIVRTTL